jgi:glycerol-3-phosphate acyltransferase PlsY
MSAAAVLLGCYLLGSVPFSYLVVKLRTGRDVRTVGSGNVGTTNVLRAAGRAAALVALVLDLGKGVAAVWLARRTAAPDWVAGGAAFAAVLGHVHPVFLGFRGGKGAATGFGALTALAPPVGAACLAVVAAVVAWARTVSLASVTAAALAPVLMAAAQWQGWVRDGGPWLPLWAAAIAALIIVRHRENLARLRAGTEPKLGQRALP